MADAPERDDSGPAKRVDRWVRDNPVVVLVVLGLFLVTTTISAAGYVRSAWTWWDERQNWREHEYRLLGGLHSDFTVERFDEVLGAPIHRRMSRNGRWLEFAYRRRDYWVQVVVPSRNPTGTVAFFSTTACDEDFEPRFRLPDGQFVTLNESTLASANVLGDVRYRYLVPASAGASLMEYAIGPHVWNFKSYAWGWNGVCGPAPDQKVFAQITALLLQGKGLEATGFVERIPRARRQFRANIVANTFAEWGPTQIGPWPPTLRIGVDEGLVLNR